MKTNIYFKRRQYYGHPFITCFCCNKSKNFTCKYDCIRGVKISDKTLSRVLDTPVYYNGFQYKTLGSKLYI